MIIVMPLIFPKLKMNWAGNQAIVIIPVWKKPSGGTLTIKPGGRRSRKKNTIWNGLELESEMKL
jgi:hypothetical protein